ncbi:MAG TPA: diguanylate cyclase, partial [Actinoplanes sp.]
MTIRRPSTSVPLALVVVLTVVLATVVSPAVTAVAGTVTALGAAVACLVQAGRRRGRARLTWIFVGLGPLCCALTQASPTDGPAGPGYFGMLASFLAGLVAVPAPPRSLVSRGRSAVDALLIAVSLLILGWKFVIDPLTAAGESVPIAYPLADIALATIALCALAGWHRGFPAAGSLMLAGAALLILPIANSVAVRLLVTEADGWRAAPAAAWFAAFALILIGAVDAARQPASAGVPAGVERDQTRMPIAIFLPYAAVLVTLVIGVVGLVRGTPGTPVGTWSGLALILLVVLRQGFIMLENRGLARRLESRVAERAAELRAREDRFRALIEQSSESFGILEA